MDGKVVRVEAFMSVSLAISGDRENLDWEAVQLSK